MPIPGMFNSHEFSCLSQGCFCPVVSSGDPGDFYISWVSSVAGVYFS